MSLLVAVLVAASSLGQVAHFLLVPHAICAEHGELVELTRSNAEVANAPAPSDTGRAQLTRTSSAADHEHCQLAARRERELLVPSARKPQLLRASCVARAPRAPDATSPLETISRWLVAPKTSPPAV